MSRCALLLTLLVLFAGAQSASASPIVGLGDDEPATLSDPRFLALGIKNVREIVPWDGVWRDPGAIDRWLAAANAHGFTPLVAFEHTRTDRCPVNCTVPSHDDFLRAFQAFRARWPWVHEFETWNEANHLSQPTLDHPELAADFYDSIVTACPGCTVTAPSLLPAPNMVDWLAGFRASVIHRVNIWAVHSYSDANRFRTTDTDQFLGLVPGEVWVTETGGIVQFDRDQDAFPYDPERAARAVNAAFGIVNARLRITRMYLWSWQPALPLDTGLMNPDGSMRPAYTYLLDGLTGPGNYSPLAAQQIRAVTVRPPSFPHRRIHIRKHGFVQLGLWCQAIAPDRCEGMVKGRTRLRGRIRFVLAAGQRFRITLGTTRAARSRVRTHGSVGATVKLVPSGRSVAFTVVR